MKRLIGAYRKGEAEDPETYTRSIAIVLSAYPQDVVRRVTDPLTGIQSRTQWLPTVNEVREACEREMLPIRNRLASEARIAEQFRERDRMAALASERERVKEGFKALADSISIEEGSRRKRPWDISPAQAETRLAQLKAEYAANPIGVDERLMPKAGE